MKKMRMMTAKAENKLRREGTRFGIRLNSRYCPDSIVLGSTFSTLKERQAYIDEQICLRCNSPELVYVVKGSMWHNKHIGFVSPEYNRELMEERQTKRFALAEPSMAMRRCKALPQQKARRIDDGY